MTPEHTQHSQEAEHPPDGKAALEAEKQPETTPAIYVACLAAYNNGILHGKWIDATLGTPEIHRRIQAMLAASPEPGAEEWAIHDYENFGPLRLGEYETIEHVAAIAEHIQKHGEAFAAWLDFTNFDQTEWHYFDDAYLGEYDSLEAYIDHLIDDLGYEQLLDERIPESIRPYVQLDREQMAIDLEADGSIFTVDNGESVYIFSTNI